MLLDEQKLRAEFAASEALQAEFADDCDAFVALKKHEHQVVKQDEQRARHRASRPRDDEIDEAALKQEFAASKKLQNEFSAGGVDAFVAFKRADASGKIRKSVFGVVSSEMASKAETTSVAPGQSQKKMRS